MIDERNTNILDELAVKAAAYLKEYCKGKSCSTCAFRYNYVMNCPMVSEPMDWDLNHYEKDEVTKIETNESLKLNTRVVFNSHDNYITAGKIYNIVNGKICLDNNREYPLYDYFMNMQQVISYFNTHDDEEIGFFSQNSTLVVEVAE